eukprot:TRINITY_DN17532_c0_g2_i3.p4 TRINITY_DN17532_c0_g2~~TRINITY_DN17532_c0_g2_i3.p4  ORF type:complete len:101 (-),score=15.99 TRINITY_DN17532_c0_g2_i3:839-1141(-)
MCIRDRLSNVLGTIFTFFSRASEPASLTCSATTGAAPFSSSAKACDSAGLAFHFLNTAELEVLPAIAAKSRSSGGISWFASLSTLINSGARLKSFLVKKL